MSKSLADELELAPDPRDQYLRQLPALGTIPFLLEGQSDEQQQQRFSLLFGTGGTYAIEDLRARAAMLEMLAAAIDLMHEELEVLVREMVVREELKE